jgi:hypothetical protein
MIRPTKGSRLLRFPFNKGVELRESLSAAAAISEPSADSEVALELALWESVKDGSHAELEAYLEQYPNGTFASLARRRLGQALCPLHQPIRRHPRRQPRTRSILRSGTPSKTPTAGRSWKHIWHNTNGHFAELARARLSSPKED